MLRWFFTLAFLLSVACRTEEPPEPIVDDTIDEPADTDVDRPDTDLPPPDTDLEPECSGPEDCASGVCEDGSCAEPTCDDGVLNGSESDVDCGGDCGPCDDGAACLGPDDCVSDVCAAGTCAEPTCEDGVLNGDETDTDCGGSCGGCDLGATCNTGADCTARGCNDGTCYWPRSCLDALGEDLSAADGTYTIDIDGPGGSFGPSAVYCDMQTDGGGWQLISAIRNDDGNAVIFGTSACTNRTPATNCAGRLQVPQVSSAAEIMVYDEGSHDWMSYHGFSGASNSALRYFSRQLGLISSSDCGASNHVCGDGSRDPALAIKRTSGHQVLYNPPMLQWWRYGGWWVGANPNSGNDGRMHATSYSSAHDLRRRHNASSNSVTQSNGHQTLWYRLDTCGDGQQNGNETDLDCGGVCGGCATGATCRVGGDCDSGICDSGTCAPPEASCLDILLASDTTPSGAYTLDPDGGDPFTTWCDMDRDGGGWTLAYATREFMARIDANPGVSWQNPANRSIPDPTNPPLIMEGHAVPADADEILWACDVNGSPATTRWWATTAPSHLTDNTHNAGGQPITVLAQSANATLTPDRYVEGSANFPTFRYMFLTAGGANSCDVGNTGIWGGNCYQFACSSSSGQCASSRRCDGQQTDGLGRYWIYYR